MCDCSNLDCGCNSTVLPIGPDGDQGIQGLYGGFSQGFVFSSTTTAPPSTGQLRFNNATPTSVTSIYVSDVNDVGISSEAFLDSFANNNNYGYIRIFKKDDSSKYWMGKVTAVTDSGAYHTLTVEYVTWNLSGSSPFSNLDEIVLTFSPAGPQGPDVLYNTTTPVTTANAGMTTLQSYTLPANQLTSNGDYIEIKGVFSTSDTSGTTIKNVDLRINGTVAHNKLAAFPMLPGIKYMTLTARATRTSATNLFVEYKSVVSNDLYWDGSGSFSFFEATVATANLTSNTNLIELRGRILIAAGAETLTAEQMVVTYFKKS